MTSSPPGVCVCTCVYICTHTCTNSSAREGGSGPAGLVGLCVLMAGFAEPRESGVCVCGAPPFVPPCLCGSQQLGCPVASGLELWRMLLQTAYRDRSPTLAEGPWTPRKGLRSRAGSGQCACHAWGPSSWASLGAWATRVLPTHVPLLAAPGDHPPTFCLAASDCSKHLFGVESYRTVSAATPGTRQVISTPRTQTLYLLSHCRQKMREEI